MFSKLTKIIMFFKLLLRFVVKKLIIFEKIKYNVIVGVS